MPHIAETVKPTPVPRCPEGHRPYRAGCLHCQRRSVYQSHLTIWERAHGIHRERIPADHTRAHLQFLITEGNRTVSEIATESGVSEYTVRRILAGKKNIYTMTQECLTAVVPHGVRKPPRSYLIPGTEGVRLLRGLSAQGWTWGKIADLLGGVSLSVAHRVAQDARPWMERGMLDRIRAVAGALGRYDIDRLPTPLPGMDRRSANVAARHGWHKLSAWRDLDITDPTADPDTPKFDDDDDDDLAAALLDGALVDLPDLDGSGLSFVDPLVIRNVIETAQRIKTEGPADDGRAGDLYIPKLELRWLEVHAAWWHAEQQGLNDTQIGALLGYDMSRTGSSEFDAGQRQVNRIRNRVIDAVALLDKHPTEWIPDWFNEHPKPIGKPNFGTLLPALLAVQPAPLGRGWTPHRIADAINATERDVVDFLVYASREGERPWRRRTGPPLRIRHRRTTTTVRAEAA